MITPLIITPTLRVSTCANGQIERHFCSNLPCDLFSPVVICKQVGNINISLQNGRVVSVPENKSIIYVEKILRNLGLSDLINTPDYTRYSWIKNAIKEIDKLFASGQKIDYIHTISIPFSSNTIGYTVKKKYGIPWIAQFYDPWHNNPARSFRFNWASKYDEKLEKCVAENADVIIHPCQMMIDDWVNAYGEDKRAKLVTLPFISEIPTKHIKERKDVNEPFVISHIGSFQQFRKSDTFVKAVALLINDNPEFSEKLKVNFVGRVTENDITLIRQNKLENIFNLAGLVREEECYKYFEESDMFLIVDTDHEHNVFYPSKIIKYFFYQKPILGITKKDSVLRKELTKTHNFPFSYYDVDGIASFLKSILIDSSVCNLNDILYWKLFSVENVMKEYSKLITNLKMK